MGYSPGGHKESDATERLSSAASLIYNVVLISALWPSDSVMHTHIYALSFEMFCSVMVYARRLDTVP